MNPLAADLIEGSWQGLAVAGILFALLPWIDRDTRFRSVPILIATILMLRYVWWRVTETLPPTDNLLDFGVGIAFLGVEVVTLLGVVLAFVTLSRVGNRSAEADANTGWLAKRLRKPLVDVFICTYDEEQEILERTVLGALSMTYPNYRLWVLDDGNRQWLRDFAAHVGANYLARSDNAHAKAGNINNALRHVAGLDEPPDFVSILDADFVPAPNFLTRAMTLFRKPDVGIVQTPQHFINPDPIQNNLAVDDLIPDEQRYFFDVLMASKDAWGTAFCCGTSSVIRMDALTVIGGFPTDSVTEDYLLTLRMIQSGYRTVYLNEQLSLGLAPEGLKEYVTQRSRWCLGFMQIVRGPDGPFNFGNKLRLRDRLSLIESLIYWTSSFAFRFATLLVPLLYLLFDIRALDVDLVDGIEHFVPYYVAQLTVVAWLSDKRVLPIVNDLAQLLAAREVLKAAAIGLLFPKGRRFQVTAKGGDRSKRFVQWRMATLFAGLLVFTVAGLVASFTLDPQRSWEGSAAVAVYWSWYNIVLLVTALAVSVERPRYRKNERIAARDVAWVKVGGEWQCFFTEDISASGMRIAGNAPVPKGAPIELRVDGQVLTGRVARTMENAFAVAVDDTIAAQKAMIRLVYSGRFASAPKRISGRAVAQRLLRQVAG